MKEKRKTPEGVTNEEFTKWALDMMTYIDTLPRPNLIRICAALNSYEWLDEFQGKPDGWEEMTPDQQHLWIADIFRYIHMKVGDKALLRYRHKTEYGVTDQEFEDWWDSRRWKDMQEEFCKSNEGRQSGNDKREYSGCFQEPLLPFFFGAVFGIFSCFLVLLGTFFLK